MRSMCWSPCIGGFDDATGGGSLHQGAREFFHRLQGAVEDAWSARTLGHHENFDHVPSVSARGVLDRSFRGFLDYVTVSKLAAAGRFGPETRAANLRTFERRAVETFASRYRPLVEFAAPMGLSQDEIADRLRKAGVECLEEGPRWSRAVLKAHALKALGMPFDLTLFEDAEFDVFWTELLKLAGSDVPHYRLPPRLPAAGQLVWRSNRKASVFLRFDNQERRLRVELNTGKEDSAGREHLTVPISNGARAAIDFIASNDGDVLRARSPPRSAKPVKPPTAVPNNEVSL